MVGWTRPGNVLWTRVPVVAATLVAAMGWPAMAASQAPEPAAECVPGCRSGYVCVDGSCVSACNPPCGEGERCVGAGVCEPEKPAAPTAPPPLGAAPAAPEVSAPPAQENSNTTIHMNVLGALQFGLIPRLETGGASGSVLFGVHFFYAGLANYLIVPAQTEDDYFVLGFGANVGGRVYVTNAGIQEGVYLGALLEYAYYVTEDDSDDLARYTTHFLIPVGELGYKWVFDSGFVLGFGLQAGAAVPVAASDEPTQQEIGCRYADSCLEERDVFPYGALTLDLGFSL